MFKKWTRKRFSTGAGLEQVFNKKKVIGYVGMFPMTSWTYEKRFQDAGVVSSLLKFSIERKEWGEHIYSCPLSTDIYESCN